MTEEYGMLEEEHGIDYLKTVEQGALLEIVEDFSGGTRGRIFTVMQGSVLCRDEARRALTDF